jgi:GST-like protein
MTYVLYGDRGSGSATTELALALAGADVDRRDVPLDRDAQRDDAYRRVNPQQKLPTLVTPGGETLTESAAILITLAERHPGCGLLPPIGSPERAQALRWLVFIAAEIYPVVEMIDYPQRFQPEGETTGAARCDALREHLRGTWKKRWMLVERAVGGDPWFQAAGPSAVDIYAAVVSRWAQTDDWRPGNLPRVEAVAAALAAHAVCGPVWRRHFG